MHTLRLASSRPFLHSSFLPSAVMTRVATSATPLQCRTLASLNKFLHAVSSSPSNSTSSSSPSTTPLTPIQRIEKDLAYCREQVKLHDNDQYLCSLLLPSSVRAGSHILRAFNLELAHIVARHSIPTIGSQQEQEVFSPAAKLAQSQDAKRRLYEPHTPTDAELNAVRVGLMKLQWWRDGLEGAMEKVGQLNIKSSNPAAAGADAATSASHAQPVLNMLAIACKQYKLTNRWISRMIEARERSLTDSQPADINALLSYSESTSSALIYLTLECLGIRNVHADHAASHIGKAMGIALMLRSLPYCASKQQCLIPKTIVADQNLDLSTLLAGENTPELSNCVFELASIAKSHIEHARNLMPQVPKEARSALVSAVLCDLFLTRLERHNFNVFAPSLGLLPTAPASAPDPTKAATYGGISLSGHQQGFQPLVLRFELMKHQWKGTY